MNNSVRIAGSIALLTAAGCSTVSDLWSGGAREQSRVRPDVAELRCEAGKTLQVRRDGPRAMWIVLPEREFRLDRQEGAAERYSNGRTTLTLSGGEASVEEGGSTTFSGCKRAG